MTTLVKFGLQRRGGDGRDVRPRWPFGAVSHTVVETALSLPAGNEEVVDSG